MLYRSYLFISKTSGGRGLVIFSLTSLLSGCAYAPTLLPPVRNQEFYDRTQERSHVTLACRALLGESETGLAFGADLSRESVLPVELILFNRSEAAYELKEAKAVLVPEGKDPLRKLTPEEMLKRVKHSTAGRTLGWGAFGTLFLFFTIPFALAGAIDSFRANRRIKRALKEAAVRPSRLLPGKELRWFEFFDAKGMVESKELREEAGDLMLELSDIRSESNNVELRFAVIVAMDH